MDNSTCILCLHFCFMVLVGAVLPNNRVWTLGFITSGKCYQLWGMDFVTSPRPQPRCFCASRNLGEDHFREVFCVLAGCWLVLLCDFLHLSTKHPWPFIHHLLGWAWQCPWPGSPPCVLQDSRALLAPAPSSLQTQFPLGISTALLKLQHGWFM